MSSLVLFSIKLQQTVHLGQFYQKQWCEILNMLNQLFLLTDVLCADRNSVQQEGPQCRGDRLRDAPLRRLHRHERILTGLLEFRLW